MKRAALYMRVSTLDQHPETQMYNLRGLAAQRGFEIVQEYTDKISGAKARRPGLDQMLKDARRRQFDVVLANLIASLLVDLAVPLSEAVRPGGRLVASGIFRDREPDVRSAFESAGLRVLGRRSETDWVALVVDRPA